MTLPKFRKKKKQEFKYYFDDAGHNLSSFRFARKQQTY